MASSGEIITDMVELTAGNVATGDFLVIVDVSDPTQALVGSTKKTQVGSLLTSPTITTPTITGPATINGNTVTNHLVGQTSAVPTLTNLIPGSGLGAVNWTGVVTGTDVAGLVTLTVGNVGYTSGGVICSLNFATSYARAPYVIVQGVQPALAAYVRGSLPTTSNFNVAFNTNISGLGTSVLFYYHVIG